MDICSNDGMMIKDVVVEIECSNEDRCIEAYSRLCRL